MTRRKKAGFVANVGRCFENILMNQLRKKFNEELKGELQKKLSLTNMLAVPRITKVVLNMGLKEGAKDKSVIEKVKPQLEAIAGQTPYLRRAKKSIAAFSLVKGSPIGLAVTLRGKKMDDFLEKLFTIVLPRLRDFRGVSLASFDGRGNYNLGISEIIVFPEIDYNKIDKVRSLQITLVTNTKDDKMAKSLLETLGMPFEKIQNSKGKNQNDN